MRTLTGIVGLIALLLHAAPTQAATIVNVAPDCFGLPVPCFTTLQAGVNNAGGGTSTVNVYPGAYNESVDISLMGSAGGAGAQDDLTIRGVDGGGNPTSGEATVTGSPGGSLGEAFYNSVEPFPFDLTLQGLDVTSTSTDAVDIEGIDGVTRLIDMFATGATYDGFDIRANNDVIISGSEASENGNDGFQIRFEDVGDLFVTDSIANDNGMVEVNPDDRNEGSGGDDGFQVQLFDGGVSFVDVETNRNGESGIEVSPGTEDDIVRSMYLERVTSNGNGYKGFLATDRPKPGREFLGGITEILGNLTILDSEFRDNASDGVEAYGFDGIIGTRVVLRRVVATGNGNLETANGCCSHRGEGILLNTRGRDTDTNRLVDVTLNNVVASDNGEGIEIHSCCGLDGQFGAVTLIDITAERNLNHGMTLRVSGNVVMRDVQLNDNGLSERVDFSAIGDDDFWEKADGLDWSFQTATDGVELALPKSIVATDITANNNVGDGLDFKARGPITLSRITAIGNGRRAPESERTEGDVGDGLYVTGPWSDLLGDTTSLSLDGCVLEDNFDDGLNAFVNGDVLVTNCQAANNGEDGFDITKNNFSGSEQQEPLVVSVGDEATETAASIELRSLSSVANGDDGIDVSALGDITMVDVCSSDHARSDERSGDGIVIKLAQSLGIVDSQSIRNSRGLALRDLTGNSYQVTDSDLAGNSAAGASHYFVDVTVDAPNVWWGAASGPDHPNNPAGGGDLVQDGFNGFIGTVDFAGFANQPFGGDDCPQREFPPDADAGSETNPSPIPSVPAPALVLLILVMAGLGRRAIRA